MVRDNHLGRIFQTEHDLTDRPMGTQLRNADGSLIYRTELDYDTQNRLVGFGEETEDNTFKTSYTYDNDNRVTEIGFGGDDKVKYTYDSLGRVNTRVVENGTDAGKLTSTYTFVDGGHGAGSTTPLIKKIDQLHIPFEYEYDNRGNIISEKRGDLTTTYAYDTIGQLIRVNDPNENVTRVYEYDRGGNMTRRIQYAYTTGALGSAVSARAYTYDANWKDQLIANGPYPLTYDAMGNLKTYADWVYEWEAGRQLKKQTQNATVVAYDYDSNGMRVRKTVSNTSGHVYATYNYTYSGSRLVHLTKNSDTLHFFYDNQGRPAKVKYNGALYTYLHNLQGDIVGIVDNGGALVVEYQYNAWGTILSRTGSMANTLGYSNPFRYRGYIYDDETWMYWVKSRYYYPELHRFISADSVLGKVDALDFHNLYTYCANNSIMKMDPNGNFAVLGSFLRYAVAFLKAAVVSAFAGMATEALINGNAGSGTYSSAGSSISAASLVDSLTTAKTTSAQRKTEEIFNYNYYFAFTVNEMGYSSLNIIDYPLNLDQALFVLEGEDIISSLQDVHGFKDGQYGIYTPTFISASKLAFAAYGIQNARKHFPRGNADAGEYYYHFHDGIHSYHIWFGIPTIFPFEE